MKTFLLIILFQFVFLNTNSLMSMQIEEINRNGASNSIKQTDLRIYVDIKDDFFNDFFYCSGWFHIAPFLF